MTDDLADEERQLLINMATVEIEASRYPLSPRIERLKRIRAKLSGEQIAAETSPTLCRGD